MLGVVMLDFAFFIKLSRVMLSVVMLSVVAPQKWLSLLAYKGMLAVTCVTYFVESNPGALNIKILTGLNFAVT
jgi:hypothetical protein